MQEYFRSKVEEERELSRKSYPLCYAHTDVKIVIIDSFRCSRPSSQTREADEDVEAGQAEAIRTALKDQSVNLTYGKRAANDLTSALRRVRRDH